MIWDALYVTLDESTVYQRNIENKHLKKLAHDIHKSTQTKLVVWFY